MNYLATTALSVLACFTSALASNIAGLTGVPDQLPCNQVHTPRIDQAGLVFGFFDTEVQLTKPATINGTRRDYVIALEVDDVISGSEAARAGIKPGDRIYQVRGIYFTKWCAKKQLETILGHDRQQVTVRYFTPSGSSQAVILPLTIMSGREP